VRQGRPDAIEVPVERVVEAISPSGHRTRWDGAVYEATDLRLNRRVALKVMTGHLIGSGTALRRFAREAQASARLEHPNIVRVYDYGPLGNDSAYLVMEHVQGVTWSDEIDRLGAFPLPLAADALDQVLDGVEAAHAAASFTDSQPSNPAPAAEGGRTGSGQGLDWSAKVRSGLRRPEESDSLRSHRDVRLYGARTDARGRGR
jgi:serine/threonine protein kinase